MATTYRPIGVENLEIAYSSPTFTIRGTGGRDLSTSNPAVVTMASKTIGQIVSVQVTVNQDFIDDSGASEIIDNLFGTDIGVAWANLLPMYIYAVLNDAENAIAFMIARIPNAIISPAAASIGAPDDAVANADTDFWSLENIDETLYESNPCLCIGSFVATKSSADDWTVGALDDGTAGQSNDGIGKFNDGTKFVFPVNQNGAAASTHMLANGGTAPVFTNDEFTYFITKDGQLTFHLFISGDGGADGAGAVNAFLALPLSVRLAGLGSGSIYKDILNITSVGLGAFTYCQLQYTSSSNTLLMDATNTTIKNASFSNGGREILGSGSYRILR